MRYFWIFFLICGVCFADAEIETARKMPKVIDDKVVKDEKGNIVYVPQVIQVKDGDIIRGPNSKWTGAVDNLHDVTFLNWNFNRKIPHTKVFTNCANLTFIDCSLVNVELQDDFTTHGSLTIHVEEYEQEGKKYRKVEDGKNKTKIYEKIEEDVDIIERDFSELSSQIKKRIRKSYQKLGINTINHIEREELISMEDTPNEKRHKGQYLSPNDNRFDYLRKSK